MKAIILSGGRGNRLKPITDYVPKSLVPLNNVPILEWQIKYLKKFGINDIIISTGYKYDQIENFLKYFICHSNIGTLFKGTRGFGT